MAADSKLTGVLLTGVVGSRPAANTVAAGTLYAGTDTGIIYQSDGSSWATWITAGGGGGIGKIIYDYTVTGSDKASIDTNVDGTYAGAFSTSYFSLIVDMYLRTDEAATGSAVKVNLNNDTGANYDRQVLAGANSSVSAATATAGTNWLLTACGASNEASLFSYHCMRFPNYAGTTGFKVCHLAEGIPDSTGANADVRPSAFGYRSTSALTRIAIAPNTAGKNLKVGSRLTIFAF